MRRAVGWWEQIDKGGEWRTEEMKIVQDEINNQLIRSMKTDGRYYRHDSQPGQAEVEKTPYRDQLGQRSI